MTVFLRDAIFRRNRSGSFLNSYKRRTKHELDSVLFVENYGYTWTRLESVTALVKYTCIFTYYKLLPQSGKNLCRIFKQCVGLRFGEENILKSFSLFNSNTSLCVHMFSLMCLSIVSENFRRLHFTRFLTSKRLNVSKRKITVPVRIFFNYFTPCFKTRSYRVNTFYS